MPTVAEQLRTARKAQKLSVEDVADMTKLRTDHVRALESGNYAVFSAPVYVRGFTRTYAKLLKLDANQLLETLSQELSAGAKPTETANPAIQNKGFIEFAALYLSRINWKIALPILILFGLIAVGSLGIRIWQYQQTRDPLADLGEGRYELTDPPPSAYLPVPAPGTIQTNSPLPQSR